MKIFEFLRTATIEELAEKIVDRNTLFSDMFDTDGLFWDYQFCVNCPYYEDGYGEYACIADTYAEDCKFKEAKRNSEIRFIIDWLTKECDEPSINNIK